MTTILGISAYYHDSAAALVREGEIVAAAQEERFSRVKHDERYPRHAIEYCLEEAGTEKKDVDAVVFYEKPLLKFDRIIETYFQTAPRGLRPRRARVWAIQGSPTGREPSKFFTHHAPSAPDRNGNHMFLMEKTLPVRNLLG